LGKNWQKVGPGTHPAPNRNRDLLASDRLLPQNIMEMVGRYGMQIGVANLAPLLAVKNSRTRFAAFGVGVNSAAGCSSAVGERMIFIGH